MIWSRGITSCNILAEDTNPLKDFPQRLLFRHEIVTFYRSTCTVRRPRPSQLKFNNLFNDHFPKLIFLFCRVKTGEVEVSGF